MAVQHANMQPPSQRTRLQEHRACTTCLVSKRGCAWQAANQPPPSPDANWQMPGTSSHCALEAHHTALSYCFSKAATRHTPLGQAMCRPMCIARLGAHVARCALPKTHVPKMTRTLPRKSAARLTHATETTAPVSRPIAMATSQPASAKSLNDTWPSTSFIVVLMLRYWSCSILAGLSSSMSNTARANWSRA